MTRMSDQSSESSGEWIVLNENDTELSPDNTEQFLNLELNYDSLCNAVSDSIRSSLSSEELEWQYEQFEEYMIPAASHSYIEDFDDRILEESNENSNVIQEEDDISKYAAINEDQDINLASISKIRCYKHTRNDYLNFILNLMLVVVLSSAIGLGIGHFWGWSHKCYTKIPKLSKAAPSDNLSDIVKMKQNMEGAIDEPGKRMMMIPQFSENISSSLSCLNSSDLSISLHHEITSVQLNNSIVTKALSETPILAISNKISNIFFDSGLSHVPNIFTQWNKYANNKQNEFPAPNVVFPSKVNEVLFYKDGIKHIEFELSNHFDIKESKDFHDSEETLENKNTLLHKDEENNAEFELQENNAEFELQENNAEFELLKQFHVKETNFYEANDLTNQLRHDLNQVIESLSAVTLRRLSDFQSQYSTSTEESKTIIKLYNDFQNIINTKITEIENFVLSAEYKIYPKPSLRYLQKMIYSLVDSVDYLMKVNFKPLSRENKKLNVHKLSNKISKVIFNFNKKWEKNSRIWVEIIEKTMFRELKERSFKKQNKQWKKKSQFERGNYRNDKFRGYSMKS